MARCVLLRSNNSRTKYANLLLNRTTTSTTFVVRRNGDRRTGKLPYVEIDIFPSPIQPPMSGTAREAQIPGAKGAARVSGVGADCGGFVVNFTMTHHLSAMWRLSGIFCGRTLIFYLDF
jgi:hypothetical protein